MREEKGTKVGIDNLVNKAIKSFEFNERNEHPSIRSIYKTSVLSATQHSQERGT